MKQCVRCGAEYVDRAPRCMRCGTSDFKSGKLFLERPASRRNWEFGQLSPTDTKRGWITVVRCPTLPDTETVIKLLADAHIAVISPDRFSSFPRKVGASGFRVQVPLKDFYAAGEIVRSLLSAEKRGSPR